METKKETKNMTSTVVQCQVESRKPGESAWTQVKPILERMDFAIAIARCLAEAHPEMEHRVAELGYRYFPVPDGRKKAQKAQEPEKLVARKKGLPPLKFGKALKPAKAGVKPLFRPGSKNDLVLQVLPKLPAVFGRAELLKALPNLADKEVSQALWLLGKARLIEKTMTHGKYQLPGAKSAAAAATLEEIHREIHVPRDIDAGNA
jgi:hypothetical protein